MLSQLRSGNATLDQGRSG